MYNITKTYVITNEDERKLKVVKKRHKLSSLSEAVRFSVRKTFVESDSWKESVKWHKKEK